ncbi:MAG: DUF4124 domain-containing protein [Sulfuricellaceae bacterium]|nr:DUF4124 domain-containing protein [Sulfuricellaceae bacterium]
MRLFVLIGLLSLAITSHADAFKCTGDNGRTVYQEQPCEKSNLKEVGKIKPPPESSKEERDRMQGVQEKNKANLDASMEARAKREEKRIEERKAASQGGQVEEGTQPSPKPQSQPQKNNNKEKPG